MSLKKGVLWALSSHSRYISISLDPQCIWIISDFQVKREPKWIKNPQSPENVTKRNLNSSNEGVMLQYLENDDKSLNKVSP